MDFIKLTDVTKKKIREGFWSENTFIGKTVN